MTDEKLVCSNITKTYGKKDVLENVSLALEKGKIYGLSRKERCRQDNAALHSFRTESRKRRNGYAGSGAGLGEQEGT